MASMLWFAALLLFASEISGLEYFRAAVLEHRPRVENTTRLSALEVFKANFVFMERAASIAAHEGVDIILFNEYGINYHIRDRPRMKSLGEPVPDPARVPFNPCTDDNGERPILRSFSCLAKKYGIYIVANVLGLQECNVETCPADGDCPSNSEVPCPEDGFRLFNTDVAFNREGALIGRYHKIHPYFEWVEVDPRPQPSAIFETEFGKFGMMVCFDSVFEDATKMSVDTVLFPTHWFDEIVPLSGVEWQQSWALANNVNFMAANGHIPGTASLGSGIYSRDTGALAYTYEPDGKDKLVIATVGVKGQAGVDAKAVVVILDDDGERKVEEETGELFPDICYNGASGFAKDLYGEYRCQKLQLEDYTVEKLEPSKTHLKVCNGDFCCQAEYSMPETDEAFYLGAKRGQNDVWGYYHWAEEDCVVLRCDPFGDKPCALRPSRSKTVFNSLKLSGSFSGSRIYPAVSLDRLRLAHKSDWYFETSSDGVSSLSFDGKSPLLRASMMSRCYDRDPEFVPWPYLANKHITIYEL